ncbi:ABC1 kinase family protein [Mariniblastus fucicola]|uniref:ABC1 atypical kinase-like domain-containing protein n=1 Tax=Mariniblastus fucicola TaxID=980251 RepID=A0A5B9PKA9_9BACT|nr:AarF/UbiB family protein [Mariniblastus fucicola]QEG25126.1 putative protein kinase UbiB [Mariniblastus fucicola]
MISNPFQHLNRHRQMIGLLYKYGTSDLIQKSGLVESFADTTHDRRSGAASHDWHRTDERDTGDDRSAVEKAASKGVGPHDLVADLEAMGPAFIKLGQLLSTRPDFLPGAYIEALTKLQDDAEPIEASEIFRVIEEELGQQPEYLFDSFEIEPLATASLGQVHCATMHDGRKVVIKVQRPGIAGQLARDIEAMEELASVCENFEFGRRYQLKHLVESLKQSLAMEIDYEHEVANARDIATNLAGFKSITIPKPVGELSTKRVITMEFVQCEKITDLTSDRIDESRSCELANDLFKSFLFQVLVHGAFHADPHPGNVGLTRDDGIVLMDHGLVVKFTPRLQSDLIKLLMAISDGKGSVAAEIAEASGVPGDNFDSRKFQSEIEKIVAANVNRSVDKMDSGTALMEIQTVAGQHDLFLPQEVIMLGRALMHLERVVSSLDPKFDPNEAIRTHAMDIMRQHSGKELSLATLYQALLESTEFAQKLPARANKLAELVANNGIEVKVNAFDEGKFISGLNKVANRISTGLIISAMIVAAALMMRIDVGWKIGGYPAIALLFLTLAGLAGSILVWRVIVSDRFEQ